MIPGIDTVGFTLERGYYQSANDLIAAGLLAYQDIQAGKKTINSLPPHLQSLAIAEAAEIARVNGEIVRAAARLQKKMS